MAPKGNCFFPRLITRSQSISSGRSGAHHKWRFAMKNVTLGLLAAAAIGAISIGSVYAMPANNWAGLGESHLQDVRLVCDRFGRCYNTRGVYRSRTYYARP